MGSGVSDQKGIVMICVLCKHGTTAPGTATMTFDEGEVLIVIRNAPAQVCDNCGEAYFDQATTKRLLEMTEEAARAGIKVQIREYLEQART